MTVGSYCTNSLSVIWNDPHQSSEQTFKELFAFCTYAEWIPVPSVKWSERRVVSAQWLCFGRFSRYYIIQCPSIHSSPSHLFLSPSAFCLPSAGVCRHPPNPTQAHLSRRKESPLDQYAWPRCPEDLRVVLGRDAETAESGKCSPYKYKDLHLESHAM